MAGAVSCADAELIAAGVEFRILHDLVKAQRRSPNRYCDDIADAMDPLINRIMDLPATTIEGLAVKADIVCWCYEKGFNDAFDADAPWDDSGTVRSLVEAVQALADRSLQGGPLVCAGG